MPEDFALHAIEGVEETQIDLANKQTVGTIDSDKTEAMTYINAKKEEPGTVSLVVQKTVNGAPLTAHGFQFKIELFSDAAMTEPYDGQYALNGEAKQDYNAKGIITTLKDHEYAMITGLAKDTYYRVTEVGDNKDYKCFEPMTGQLTESVWREGVNIYTDQEGRALTLTKKVEGDSGGTAPAFTFDVTFRDENGRGVENLKVKGGGQAEEKAPGRYLVVLKGDESVTFEGLPANYGYFITEQAHRTVAVTDIEIVSSDKLATVADNKISNIMVNDEKVDVTYTNTIEEGVDEAMGGYQWRGNNAAG